LTRNNEEGLGGVGH
jgi:hypothetical protein